MIAMGECRDGFSGYLSYRPTVPGLGRLPFQGFVPAIPSQGWWADGDALSSPIFTPKAWGSLTRLGEL